MYIHALKWILNAMTIPSALSLRSELFIYKLPLLRRCRTGSRPLKMRGIPSGLRLPWTRSPRLFPYPSLKSADLEGFSRPHHFRRTFLPKPLHHLTRKTLYLPVNALNPPPRYRYKVLLWHRQSHRKIQPKLYYLVIWWSAGLNDVTGVRGGLYLPVKSLFIPGVTW